jgi:hypothetical protein
MRDLNALNRWRDTSPEVIAMYGGIGDHSCGAFLFGSPTDGKAIRALASSGMGWDHVSISRRNRTPTWREMEWVKHMFFDEHEVAMQLHVPRAQHINVHPYCLHLWRPQLVEIPLPPAIMVG